MYAKHVFVLCIVALLGITSLAAQSSDAPLVQAAKKRDMATVRSLLAKRVNVTASDAEGMTALHWAAHWDNLEIVKLLIRAGANAKAKNRYGVTPLHEAATVSNVAMIETLLKAGANPNDSYGAGETALMTAARTGNVAAVKMMLTHGGDVNAAEEWRGQTALMWAGAENHPAVAQLLIDHGANVNARSVKYDFVNVKMAAGGALMDRPEGGLTPIFFAAREGAIEVGQVLIAAGADVDVTETQYGFTPTMTALFNGHYDFAAMLLDKGADANDGSLYIAIEMRNLATYSNRPNPPERDRLLTSLDSIKQLLARGADPNRVYTKTIPPRQAQGNINVPPGATPLHRAARSMDLTTIQLLMEKGANPSIALKDGSTPLMMASGLGAPRSDDDEFVDRGPRADPLDAVKLFVEAGADINAVHDVTGNTASHYAAQRGSDRIVEFLAGKGAKLDAKNKAGKTLLDLAPKNTAALIRKLMGEPAASNAAPPQ